jgi:hypothetical protein
MLACKATLQLTVSGLVCGGGAGRCFGGRKPSRAHLRKRSLDEVVKGMNRISNLCVLNGSPFLNVSCLEGSQDSSLCNIPSHGMSGFQKRKTVRETAARPPRAARWYHRFVKPPTSSRRKLTSAVIRKAITAYYSEQEQQEIAQAAKQQGISLSGFIASASLAEARRLNKKR